LTLAVLGARRAPLQWGTLVEPEMFGEYFGWAQDAALGGIGYAASRGIVRTWADSRTGRPRFTGGYDADDESGGFVAAGGPL